MNTTKLTTTLDQIENRLPELPASVLRLQRAVAATSCASMRRVTTAVNDSVTDIASVADNGTRTVLGTSRWVAERTISTAATGARQISGQVRAQSRRTAEAINDEVVELTEDLTDRTEAVETITAEADLVRQSRAELYERAKALDIEGRSSMSKDELVSALLDS